MVCPCLRIHLRLSFDFSSVSDAQRTQFFSVLRDDLRVPPLPTPTHTTEAATKQSLVMFAKDTIPAKRKLTPAELVRQAQPQIILSRG